MTLELNALTEEQFRANRFDLLSRLADDLAHEIKNPLNSIVINLEVLRARIRKGETDGALERVGVIEDEARRLYGLVDRMLQLMRPERTDAEVLAIDQVLDELIPLVEAQARLARVEFRWASAPGGGVRVRRDILKYAMLSVLAAQLQDLGDAGGDLDVACALDDDRVVLRFVVRRPVELPTAADVSTVAAAAALAGTLLAPAGGQIGVLARTDQCTVTIDLPRVSGA